MTIYPRRAVLIAVVACLFSGGAFPVAQQPKITTPKEQFGFEIGADYQLTTYTQLTEYWTKLDRESDRMSLVDMGKTAEGRSQWMAIVTAPENHRRLERFKEISRRLALAEGLTDDQARALAAEGRAVVWIDGGLHATEVLGSHQLIETLYQFVSRTDPETLRILRDVIILFVHANPDGHELVGNWYMREQDPTRRSTGGIPRLYQKYIGHDNNRDFYLSSQPETTNMNRQMYHEWFPQIMYNHHQSGPIGTVLFAPPFRDPFNYLYDPLIPLGIDLVGAAMHNRFALEGKPGATMRRGAPYSTWFNGGIRTTSYFHNMIGLLTESIGNPTPMEIPFVPSRQLPSGDLPYPIAPQKWHFRQSIEYSLTANRAVLDLAAKHREDFLFNIYRMGRNSIDRGSRDTWTPWPRRVDAVRAAIAKDRPADARAGVERLGTGAVAPIKYYDLLREPDARDPRGYILPSDQPDFLTAVKFANALIKTGVTVHRATAPFDAGTKRYPAGSIVVKTAQAFRPHILDMFEPQDHPNDIPYPGGAPTPPYDSAGYTLAYQMGVQFDRLLDGFDGPFERVSGFIPVPEGRVTGAPAPVGFVLSHRTNDAFVAVNRLLKSKHDVFWMSQPAAAIPDAPLERGLMYVTAQPSTPALLQKLAAETGLQFTGVASRPGGEMLKLRPVRIGLWDRYGGSMPSGWVRWIFEQYEFPFEVVYPQALDAGRLKERFDVIVLVDEAVPARDQGGATGPRPESIPAEWRDRLGSVTVARTVPQLREFLELGGTVLAIGGSTSLARHLNLPLSDALVELAPAGGERPLPAEKYFVPGSVLQVAVDNTHPLAWGMPERADVMFDNSPVFRLDPDAALRGVRAVAWFDSATPLRSGWAWGQEYLKEGVAVAEATVGKGRLFLFGPEITFRAQPHGTFKLLFNGIYYGAAEAARAAATSTAAP